MPKSSMASPHPRPARLLEKSAPFDSSDAADKVTRPYTSKV